MLSSQNGGYKDEGNAYLLEFEECSYRSFVYAHFVKS